LKHTVGGAAAKPLEKCVPTPAAEAATHAVRHVFQQILLQRKKVYDRCGVPITASHLARALAITTNSALLGEETMAGVALAIVACGECRNVTRAR